ncbi:hypothetical protein WN944_014060 [Citrus x changshan-huyou]|uniref:Uncharacterized protein n=1 Tax=Citrus x changshan-huyou TaxID=2935761 RepID=A0AAP0QL89_9ROSI
MGYADSPNSKMVMDWHLAQGEDAVEVEPSLEQSKIYQQSVGSTGNGVPLSGLTGFAPQFESQGSRLCWENMCLPVRAGTSSLGCGTGLKAEEGNEGLHCNNSDLLLLFPFVGLFLSCAGQEGPSTVAAMERKEQEALYSTIQGFVGKWWNVSDLYPDPCGRTGLQFTTILSFAHSAKFSNHLCEFNHLNSLSIFNCFSSPSQSPIEIPSSNWQKLANSLDSLEFRSNPHLIGTIPTSIDYLKNLQSLVLLEKGLTGKLPIEPGKLVNLRRLALAGNQITGQIPASIGGLTKLLIFDLSRNNLSGSMLLTLGKLAPLLKLDLSYNNLQEKIPKEIGNLHNVTFLDLRSNNFSGGLVGSIEEMVSLKEMVVSNNPIFGGGLNGIRWENLQNLEIWIFVTWN